MKLSQSRVKSFETTKCYRKWYGEQNGELQKYTSIPMLYGSFFEKLCLGSGAGYQDDVTDLPRLKNGAKSIDQQRIELQAAKFKRMFDENSSEFIGWHIKNKQIKLSWGSIEGTIDFDAYNSECQKPWDLKLNADLDSDWGYWSNPEELDLLQSPTYVKLYEENVLSCNEFSYIIFDYSPKMNVAIIDVTVTDEAIAAALKRFEEAEATMLEFDLLEEWPRVPNPVDCRYCRLDCNVKINKAGYIYKQITL